MTFPRAIHRLCLAFALRRKKAPMIVNVYALGRKR